MKNTNFFRWLAPLLLGSASLLSLPAHAGKTLDTIKSRGQLVCGVNVALAGFSAADSNGNWKAGNIYMDHRSRTISGIFISV